MNAPALKRCCALPAISLAILACVSCSTGDPVQERTITEDLPQRFKVGIGISIHDDPAVIDAARAVGIQSIRTDAPWAQIERVAGQYEIPASLEQFVDNARSMNIEPLLILAYGNPLYGSDKPRTDEAREAFSRYAQFVVGHFKGRVRYYDLWNEWSGSVGHTTPTRAEDYVALAQRVYPQIKRIDPDAIILSGGIFDLKYNAYWYGRFLGTGGLHYVDAISVHPYNFKRTEATPEAALDQMDQMQELARMANQGRPVDFYVTEFGYPAYGGEWGRTQDEVALDLVKFMLLAAGRPYVRGVWWYCLRNQGLDPAEPEHQFGVYDFYLNSLPQAQALHQVTSLLGSVGYLSAQGGSGGLQVQAHCKNGQRLQFSLGAIASEPIVLPRCEPG